LLITIVAVTSTGIVAVTGAVVAVTSAIVAVTSTCGSRFINLSYYRIYMWSSDP
jgi:hypothetical protein